MGKNYISKQRNITLQRSRNSFHQLKCWNNYCPVVSILGFRWIKFIFPESEHQSSIFFRILAERVSNWWNASTVHPVNSLGIPIFPFMKYFILVKLISFWLIVAWGCLIFSFKLRLTHSSSGYGSWICFNSGACAFLHSSVAFLELVFFVPFLDSNINICR